MTPEEIKMRIEIVREDLSKAVNNNVMESINELIELEIELEKECNK